MDFKFDVNRILPNQITICTCNSPLEYVPYLVKNEESLSPGQSLSLLIDRLGIASAKAQNLPQPITSAAKLRQSADRLYILRSEAQHYHTETEEIERSSSRQPVHVLGILRMGTKRLFIYDHHGVQHELNEPLCVFDFYIDEREQRKGHGKFLFDYMLQKENVIPRHLAVDRPSNKFSSFLAKYYQLDKFIPQSNNYVVYQGFFRDRPPDSSSSKSRYANRNTGYPRHNATAPVDAIRPNRFESSMRLADYQQTRIQNPSVNSRSTFTNGFRHEHSLPPPLQPSPAPPNKFAHVKEREMIHSNVLKSPSLLQNNTRIDPNELRNGVSNEEKYHNTSKFYPQSTKNALTRNASNNEDQFSSSSMNNNFRRPPAIPRNGPPESYFKLLKSNDCRSNNISSKTEYIDSLDTKFRSQSASPAMQLQSHEKSSIQNSQHVNLSTFMDQKCSLLNFPKLQSQFNYSSKNSLLSKWPNEKSFQQNFNTSYSRRHNDQQSYIYAQNRNNCHKRLW